MAAMKGRNRVSHEDYNTGTPLRELARMGSGELSEKARFRLKVVDRYSPGSPGGQGDTGSGSDLFGEEDTAYSLSYHKRGTQRLDAGKTCFSGRTRNGTPNTQKTLKKPMNGRGNPITSRRTGRVKSLSST
jgi:hypothetical protein